MKAHAPVGDLGRVGESLFQAFGRQALARLNVSGGALIDACLAQRFEKGLDGADDLTTGGLWFEHLPDKTFEGQPQAEDTITAVNTFILGSQEVGRQKLSQLLEQRREIQLAQALKAVPDLGGKLGAQGGEEWCASHRAVYIPPY